MTTKETFTFETSKLPMHERKEIIQKNMATGLTPSLPNPVELLYAIHRVVKQSPLKYANALYIENGTPTCMIGVALSQYFNWTNEHLRSLNKENIAYLYDWCIELNGNYLVNYDDRDPFRNSTDQSIILSVIEHIQSEQDTGQTWGRVMNSAIALLHEYRYDDVDFVEKICLGVFNHYMNQSPEIY